MYRLLDTPSDGATVMFVTRCLLAAALGLAAVVQGDESPSATPSLPDLYHCRIEIHDGARGWQPGWQKADYKTQLFSEARTAIDPKTGTNRTDESINDAANKKVYTVWRTWNRNHTEQGCQLCPTCTATPLPQDYISQPKLVKSGVDCALGSAACDEWTGNYQGPRVEPVTVLVSTKDVQQLVKITWPATSSGSELYIQYTHWHSGSSNLSIPTDCGAPNPTGCSALTHAGTAKCQADASCEWCDGPGPVRPPPAKNHGFCTKKGDPCPDAKRDTL